MRLLVGLGCLLLLVIAPIGDYTSQAASLTVTLGPPTAVAQGALWKLDDQAPRASGDLATGLLPGLHTVRFTKVKGFATPAKTSLFIEDGRAASLLVNYGQGHNALVPNLAGLTLEDAEASLEASHLRGGTVTPVKLIVVPAVAVISQASPAGTLLPTGSQVAYTVSLPPDPNRFLTLVNTSVLPTSFLNPPNPDPDDFAAEVYYQTVDPRNERTTLQDWLNANGVNSRGGKSAEAIYFNDRDLGFGRDMHMWRKGDRIVYWVDNYPTVDNAIHQTGKIATVAMELSPVPCGLEFDGSQNLCDEAGGDPYIKFFTFDGNGNRIDSVDLDGRGKKTQPTMCLTCHGGSPQPPVLFNAQNQPAFPNFGDVDARFIPFDLDSFTYSKNKHFTRNKQAGAFKKLNAGVLDSYSVLARRRFDYSGAPVPFNVPANPGATPVLVQIPIQVANVVGKVSKIDVLFPPNPASNYLCDASHFTNSPLHGPGGEFGIGDLKITVTSPSNTTVTLVDHLPRSFANPILAGDLPALCNTTFDDGATLNLRDFAPPQGSDGQGVFSPAQPLDAFAGEDSNGTWTLTVTDDVALPVVGGLAGEIRNWSLRITTDASPSEAAPELIRGWYPKGVTSKKGSFNGSFVPSGWMGQEALYLDVVKKDCRNCHIQQSDRINPLDFSTFDKFQAFRDRILELVFREGTMPDALRTFDLFWLSADPSAVAELASFAGAGTSGPGLPIAIPGSYPGVNLNEPVVVDGSRSVFATKFTWTFNKVPTKSTAKLSIVPGSPSQAKFVPDLPGDYVLTLAVSDGTNTNVAEPITITAAQQNVPKSFATDVVPLFQADCVGCHTGASAPGGFRLDDSTTRYANVAVNPSTAASPNPRVDKGTPTNSLVLRKPSNQVSHGGGLRPGFDLSGDHSRYDVILKWIQEGAQNN